MCNGEAASIPPPAAHCISFLLCCPGKSVVLHYKGIGGQILKKSESLSSLVLVLWKGPWASCVPGKCSTTCPGLQKPLRRNHCLGKGDIDLFSIQRSKPLGPPLVRALLPSLIKPTTDTRGLKIVLISFPKATQSVTQRAGFSSCGVQPQIQTQLLQLPNPFSTMKVKASKTLLTKRVGRNKGGTRREQKGKFQKTEQKLI